MELCYLDGEALDTLKNSLDKTFGKYLTERDNSWVSEVCQKNPFVKFRDVPDFELAPLNENFSPGEVDFNNSKILYRHLNFLTPRQAADERFWAGFCHGAFYDYVRRRWGYDKPDNLSTVKAADIIKYLRNRFFFYGDARFELITNTLAKYWWAGYVFSDAGLDALGAKDFSSKLFSIASRTFIGNENLRRGFVQFLRHFKDRGIILNREKHIQAAMIELNMTGGAVILDCLSSEEVAAIMIAHVEKILSQKNSLTVKFDGKVV